MKKSTEECRKDCDVYEDWKKLEAQNAGLVLDKEQLRAEIEKLKETQKQSHKCAGCDKTIYYYDYCPRCRRQWES